MFEFLLNAAGGTFATGLNVAMIATAFNLAVIGAFRLAGK